MHRQPATSGCGPCLLRFSQDSGRKLLASDVGMVRFRSCQCSYVRGVDNLAKGEAWVSGMEASLLIETGRLVFG